MEKNKIKIPVYAYFIAVSAIIIFLFPRQNKFRYAFVENQPWKYSLLTAPFDFPIFKSTSELKQEQDSVLATLVPYFQRKEPVAGDPVEKFVKAYSQHLPSQWNRSYYQYALRTLKEIYTAGIISVADHTFLTKNQHAYCKIVEGNEAFPRNTNDLFTVKSAYLYLLNNCPENLDVAILKTGDLNEYLSENLLQDEKISTKVKNETLQKISPSNGMVQAGQKIIDKGEIVDTPTYKILNSLQHVYETRTNNVQRQGWLWAGSILLVCILVACFYCYLYFFRHQKIFSNNKDMLFLLSMILLFTVLTELAINHSWFNIYIIPYAMIPITIRTFFDSRTASMTYSVTILMCALMALFPFEFVILQLVAGMIVIYTLKDLSTRVQLIQCSFYVFLSYVVLYWASVMYLEGEWSKINWMMFIYFGINCVLLMFTYALIYIIERLFRYTSGITLVELSDIHSPVLRKFSEIAPGSFQHSIQVSILASAAASKIRANAWLVRTGALYHDIGKMKNSAYFTENQGGEYNPHKELTYEQSSKIITNHVTDGMQIAEKYSIPKVICDFIQTHHGVGKTWYFYNSQRNEHPDDPIDDAKFTYRGANPFSKETAIVMMADAVEASSRSLKDYSAESISELVHRIIDRQIKEGLLKNAPISLRDIEVVKGVFIEKLITMYHSRVSYPELKS